MSGSLSCTTNPSGAEIFIDDVDQSQVTNSVIPNILAGNHTLKLTFPGYSDYTTTFTINDGQTTTLDITLTPIPTTGTLDISSEPEGAEINIDGADQGKVTIVPYQPIINIPAGNHTLTLTLTGYQPYTTTFTITAGQTTTLNPILTPVALQNCPCSIWSPSTVPGTITVTTDPNAVELGVKFRSDIDGYITGIRFYKGPSNTGTHIGSLWSATGTLLGQVTFSGESASGWQQANFSTPIAVTANTTYIASYNTSVGLYSDDNNYFTNTGVDNPPLHALQSGVDGGNGLFEYGATPTFPINTHLDSNYWVDVVFVTTLPPPTGTLDISSVPGSAEIFIDDVDQNKLTESVIQNIPAGDHTLKLTLAGYQDYSTTFTITSGQTTILTITLIQTINCSFIYNQ
jgi:hypothetical protein